MSRSLQKLTDRPFLAETLSAVACIIYAMQSWLYAHSQLSVLDEGLYLYKGFLFSSGRYFPFQDFGPLSNQMPFSFLIPGTIQVWFGPGLRQGRYFAILLALLMLAGIWLVSRRLGNRWLAALAVWLLALNPMPIKFYSQGISEGLVACLLIWVLFFTLGSKRPYWQIAAGSFLAGMIVLIRINLLPLLPLLVLYIFWENGKKSGILSAAVVTITFLGGHLPFLPNILRLWAYWLPEGLTPFLRAWYPPAGAIPKWDPEVGFLGRLTSLIGVLRFHFIPVAGGIFTWLFWGRKDNWKSSSHRKAAIFLSVLFIVLLAVHAWATLGKDYCVFCFAVYVCFFEGLGLLILICTWGGWRWEAPRWRQILAVIAVLVGCTAIGYAAYTLLTDRLDPLWARDFLNQSIPRIKSFRIQPGTSTLWGVVSNKFGIAYEDQLTTLPVLPMTFVGFLTGLCILLVGWLILRSEKIQKSKRLRYGSLVMLIFLTLGLLLLPTGALGGGYHTYDCQGDMLLSYESAGKALRDTIPPDSQVYWRGGLSPVPLLYIPDAQIYPPQLNGDYSFRLGGDPVELLRYGWWDESLSNQWLSEAEYILVEDHYLEGDLAGKLFTQNYTELPATPPTAQCRTDSRIRIFQNNR